MVKVFLFLEIVNLVLVNNRKIKLEVIELGKKVINKVIDEKLDLFYNLFLI